MSPAIRLLAAVSAPLFLLACATGAPPLGGTASDDAGAGKSSGNAYGSGGSDGGTTKKDAGTTGATGGTDAGGSGSGSGSGGSGGSGSGGSGSGGSGGGGGSTAAAGDCSGTDSTQLASSYDDACNNYYYNSGGDPTGNPCNPGGSDCDALAGEGGYTSFCCFTPTSSSNCDFDYDSTPQCIPQ